VPRACDERDRNRPVLAVLPGRRLTAPRRRDDVTA
jgi:hypothetical protein